MAWSISEVARRHARLESDPLAGQRYTEAGVVGRVIWIQILVTIAGAGLGLAWDVVTGYSALLGGLVAIGINAYFMRRVFAERVMESAAQLVATTYRAEIAKLVLAAVLFAAVFTLVNPLDAIALLAVFGVVYVSANVVLLGASPPTGRVETARET